MINDWRVRNRQTGLVFPKIKKEKEKGSMNEVEFEEERIIKAVFLNT